MSLTIFLPEGRCNQKAMAGVAEKSGRKVTICMSGENNGARIARIATAMPDAAWQQALGKWLCKLPELTVLSHHSETQTQMQMQMQSGQKYKCTASETDKVHVSFGSGSTSLES